MKVTCWLRSMIRMEFNDYCGATLDLTRYLGIDSTEQQNFEAMYLRSKLYLSLGERTKAVNDLTKLAQARYSDSEKLLEELR